MQEDQNNESHLKEEQQENEEKGKNEETQKKEELNQEQLFYKMPPSSGSPARKIAEGAMMIALAVLLGILAYFLPVFGIMAVFLWPIPITLLIKKHGFGLGVVSLAAVGLLLGLFLGPFVALAMLLNMGGVGLWYGYSFRKNLSPGKSLLIGVVVAACSVIITLLISGWTIGLAFDGIVTQLNQMVARVVAMYEEMGVLTTLAGEMSAAEFTTTMQKTMLTLLPASLIIAAMFMASVSFLVTSAVFRRLGYSVHRLPKFTEWHLPWVCLWGLIIALIAQIASGYLDLKWLQPLAVNVLYLYLPILIVAGVSLLFWFAKNSNMPSLKWILIVGIFLFTQYIVYFLLMMGLMDCVVDFREMFRKARAEVEKNQPKN